MEPACRKKLYNFYSRELKENILGFWLPRCEDRQFGGYLNCFDNRGENLVSHDKYTWSQGRFLWMFSRLASTQAPLFSEEERKEFLRLAESGYSFLRSHCLMGEDDWRCIFLMERDGTPKKVGSYDTLDMSIYADCFVIIGMAAYSVASGDGEAYAFGKNLYLSVVERVESGKFNTLPYPLGSAYRAHGIPMILTNVARELHCAAMRFDRTFASRLLSDMEKTACDVIDNFRDGSSLIHEVIGSDNSRVPGLLGNHINPGHSIEDSWFLDDAAVILGRNDISDAAALIMKTAFSAGWDAQYGGILHFVNIDGDPLVFESDSPEPTVTLVKGGWGDKLWWVHSETLYASLRFYLKTGDPEFLDIHDRTFDYVFSHFPNPDRNVGEWIQILTREGLPQEKVVALPVKDPFHITRNLLLICELLG
ncbi:MAG: AGE family epimerase/isomerase [Spirochaetales bacterium]|nr:AGE family epimerase/isomerase [Spirochaetales bacterium]